MNNKNNKKKKLLINGAIPHKKVLVVGEDNSSVEMSCADAIAKAKEQGMDLIMISVMNDVAITKICDHGKFLYELKQKSRNSKKNVIKVKSITVKPKIDMHDLTWKANQAIDWFKLGDRVQFIVRATGRMSLRADLITSIFEKFCELVAEHAEPKGELKKTSNIQYETHFFPIKK